MASTQAQYRAKNEARRQAKKSGASKQDIRKITTSGFDREGNPFSGSSNLPAARGNEFAPAFEKEIERRNRAGGNLTPENVFGRGSITGFLDFSAGETSSPSVFSSDTAFGKISQLNSSANNLPFYDQGSGGDTGQNEEGGFGDDFDTESILGLGDEEKKKKKYAKYAQREGTNIALPSDYFETMYGEAGPIFKEISRMRQTSDKVAREQIANIQSQFDTRRQEQEALNARGISNIKQVLSLGGSSRYAPISSQGIVSSAEAEGIKRLTALDNQERQAISEVRIAQQNKDYELMEAKMDVLEQIRSEKSSATEDLNTDMAETAAQIQKDNTIAGLISQGISDPVAIFQEAQKQGVDLTLSEIGTALKNLDVGPAEGAFKIEPKQIGPLLGLGMTMNDIKTLQEDLNSGASIEEVLAGVDAGVAQQVKEILGVPEAAGDVKLGIGAKTPIEEQMIRTRLFPKAASILNKGTLSDADRKIIDERIAYFRDNGLSEQQILDVFSGWSADVSTPFNQSFRDIMLSTQDTGEGVSQALTSLGSLLASGNYKGAMNKVENIALENIKDQDGYLGKPVAETYTQRIDRIKRLLKQSGEWDGIGPLEGNFNNILRRVKGKDATRIKAELTQLYQTFRKENIGTAATEAEKRFLDPLFASVTDTKGNFLEKLDVFQQGILDEHNASRRTVALPAVRVLDILDPNERLTLYAEQVTSDKANSLDI